MTDGPWSGFEPTVEASPWSDIIGADWTSVREFDLGELSAADRAYLIGLVGPMDPLVADLERQLESAQAWAVALEQRLDQIGAAMKYPRCRCSEVWTCNECKVSALLSSPLEAS